MIPVAAGAALAHSLAGGNRVAINFIGDGGTSTGDFHEGLNMAAVWKLPLVLVVENNGYAFATPASQQYAAAKLSDRGPGYGVPAQTVDGNDPDAMADALEAAVARAREGGGPTLVEAMLGRIRGHSEADDSLKVVPAAELEAHLAADPVPAYARRLEADGVMDAKTRERLEEQIGVLVEEAVHAALGSDPPPPETARRPALAPVEAFEPSVGQVGQPEKITYIEAIHRALMQEMERNESLLLMGQDIGVFEGAFRVTRGMHARWPQRVLDTPIAESGTLGIAIGAALAGRPSVVEMQFGDFVTCGFNQIVNVAAKLYYRWQVPCPIVVRLPTGGGVTAGPFHSQNPEAWFAHVAGLKVVCPATARDAAALLKAAIRDPNPVIFCEHKYLYRRIKQELPEDIAAEDLGVARVLRSGADITLIGYGATTWTCLQAAEALESEGASVEVVDLRTLVPFDADTVLASVRRTGRVVIVHEAQVTGGFGGEIAAQIAEQAFPWLDAPLLRVAYPDRPVPYARSLEDEILPAAADVVRAVRESLAY
jgi:2-oxoisovalerate dehydrogenase E1 component